MTTKTIEVVVSSDGGITIDAAGFHGADCEKATAFLEQALGVVDARTKKPDYYRREALRRQQRIGS